MFFLVTGLLLLHVTIIDTDHDKYQLTEMNFLLSHFSLRSTGIP